MNLFLKIAIPLLIILLALGGGYVYMEQQKQAKLDAARMQEEGQRLVRETDALSVDVAYPIIPGNGEKVQLANAAIREEIIKRVQAFENDAMENAQLGIGLPKEVKSTVKGSPSIEETNERYIALFLGIEWYLRGAAHPAHTIDTYIYDFENGELLSVSDLFTPGAAYLEKLSALSKEDLRNQSREGDMGYIYDERMVNEGTAPIKENFSKILPLHDGLMIYFDEYQVAPYAAGPQQVAIPYAKITELIDKEGVLGMYIK